MYSGEYKHSMLQYLSSAREAWGSDCMEPDLESFPLLRPDQIPLLSSDWLHRSIQETDILIAELQHEVGSSDSLLHYTIQQRQYVAAELHRRAALAFIPWTVAAGAYVTTVPPTVTENPASVGARAPSAADSTRNSRTMPAEHWGVSSTPDHSPDGHPEPHIPQTPVLRVPSSKILPVQDSLTHPAHRTARNRKQPPAWLVPQAEEKDEEAAISLASADRLDTALGLPPTATVTPRVRKDSVMSSKRIGQPLPSQDVKETSSVAPALRVSTKPPKYVQPSALPEPHKSSALELVVEPPERPKDKRGRKKRMWEAKPSEHKATQQRLELETKREAERRSRIFSQMKFVKAPDHVSEPAPLSKHSSRSSSFTPAAESRSVAHQTATETLRHDDTTGELSERMQSIAATPSRSPLEASKAANSGTTIEERGLECVEEPSRSTSVTHSSEDSEPSAPVLEETTPCEEVTAPADSETRGNQANYELDEAVEAHGSEHETHIQGTGLAAPDVHPIASMQDDVFQFASVTPLCTATIDRQSSSTNGPIELITSDVHDSSNHNVTKQTTTSKREVKDLMAQSIEPVYSHVLHTVQSYTPQQHQTPQKLHLVESLHSSGACAAAEKLVSKFDDSMLTAAPEAGTVSAIQTSDHPAECRAEVTVTQLTAIVDNCDKAADTSADRNSPLRVAHSPADAIVAENALLHDNEKTDNAFTVASAEIMERTRMLAEVSDGILEPPIAESNPAEPALCSLMTTTDKQPDHITSTIIDVIQSADAETPHKRAKTPSPSAPLPYPSFQSMFTACLNNGSGGGGGYSYAVGGFAGSVARNSKQLRSNKTSANAALIIAAGRVAQAVRALLDGHAIDAAALTDSDDDDTDIDKPVADDTTDAAPSESTDAVPTTTLPSAFLIRISTSHKEVQRLVREAMKLEPSWQEVPSWAEHTPVWNLMWSWGKPVVNCNHLLTCQKINHFKNAKELTRKDLLKHNLARYQCLNAKMNAAFTLQTPTFLLPKEYLQFAEAFGRGISNASAGGDAGKSIVSLAGDVLQKLVTAMSSTDRGVASKVSDAPVPNLWIMKPVSMSRGRGISLVSDLSQVKYAENMLIQKYIHNPLLLDGYKFDLRLYVLVTSFSPLEAFIYRKGFARLSSRPFTIDPSQIADLFVHLTNSSIQKHSESAKSTMSSLPGASKADAGGTKCSLDYLWRRLREQGIDTDKLWDSIIDLVVKSLVCVDDVIPNQPNSFEVFGYDVLIDNTLKPWLIEVNGSPSLGVDSEMDMEIKKHMVHDTIKLVDPLLFDREALAELIETALPKGDGAKDFPTAVNKVFSSRRPRTVGELPQHLGHYQRICPGSDQFNRVMKLKMLNFRQKRSQA